MYLYIHICQNIQKYMYRHGLQFLKSGDTLHSAWAKKIIYWMEKKIQTTVFTMSV